MLYENESYRNLFELDNVSQCLIEGIDIDEKFKTVSYNPSHENYVSTSVEKNPTKNTGFGKDINVWSIFRRNRIDKRDNIDGNPLLYAFKNENDWKFKRKEDRTNILNQIALIVDKFNSNNQYNPTIVLPSGSQLNIILANIIKQRNPLTIIINDVLVKMSADDVYNNVTKFNTEFRKLYNTRKKFDTAIRELKGYIYLMNQKRNGLFTYHFIKNDKMREVIGQTLKLSSDDCGKYSEEINEKDILIVDDSISQGNTVNYACDLIRSTFTPKSITVLTLFSKL